MALSYDPVSQQLVVAHKSMTAIEHYLIVRYFMYAQVYNHPKNIAATWVLEQAFIRARQLLGLGQLTADETVTDWLAAASSEDDQAFGANFRLAAYLEADDGVFIYHLQRWQHSSDKILADLCRRYLDRDLLKAVDVSGLSGIEQNQLYQQACTWVAQNHLSPDSYVGFRVSLSRGYTLYQRGINLQTATGLQEISELSPLVQTLIQPFQRVWLLYPREIEPLLKRSRHLAQSS